MALFGPRDYDLPIMTQLYQLEIPVLVLGSDGLERGDDTSLSIEDRKELIAFLRRSELEEYARRIAPGEPLDSSDLLVLHSVYLCVRELMERCSDNGGRGLGGVLNRLRQIYARPYTPDVIYYQTDATGIVGIYPGLVPDEVPLSEVVMDVIRGDTSPALVQVLEAVYQFLDANPSLRPGIQRCDFCHNPFLVVHRRSKYCSARCLTRAMADRRDRPNA